MVQVLLQETGEHVLVTAGEVHLQRCLQDLKERYAKIEIIASQPIVPFRETIVSTEESGDSEPVTLQTANKLCTIRLRAVPLPERITHLLEANMHLLKVLDQERRSKNDSASNQMKVKIQQFKSDLSCCFESHGPQWSSAVDKILSFGPRRCGPNILMNESGADLSNAWSHQDASAFEHLSSIVNGFQLATLAGPLCEEPLMSVCFIMDRCSIQDEASAQDAHHQQQVYGPFSGQIMSTMKEACRRAFQSRPQRLMAAMYSCSILVSGEVLGK